MKLDLMVITVHPDDAELGAGGTIAKYVAEGRKVGVVDLTRGELGTRGTAVTRAQEAADAARILGVAVRENLEMRDGFFANDEQHQLKIIEVIRKYRPELVITNAIDDRHPDHGRAEKLINDALFLSGLRRIQTYSDAVEQEAFRPRLQLQLIQDRYIQPDVILDITPYWEVKRDAILAYKTQFNADADSDEPQTYISTPDFLLYTEGRAREFGRSIQATYGEGFTSRKILGVDDLFHLK